MSLFSLDNILLNESSTINIDNIGYMDTELKNQSFVQEGYDFILEIGRDYMNAEKTFYTEVLGSYGDNEIITESFDGFFNKIKEIINKFIEWIKKVFKQFVAKINALFNNEKYIKKNQKLLNKFESQDEFEFNGYEFTNIDKTNIPAANAQEAFIDETNGKGYFNNWYTKGDYNDTADPDRTLRNGETETLNTALDNSLTTLNDNLEDFYDTFRGKVIGKDEKIDSNDYPNELFSFFRNDENTTSNITIDATYVLEAYRRFDKYKDLVKSIEKTQKDMIKDYEALEKYLDKMIKLTKSDSKNTLSFTSVGSNKYVSGQITALGVTDFSAKTVYDTSTYDKMNNYLKTQSSKVSRMSTIHTQAFSAKLEAAKDQFKQDKKILYKALQQVIKRSNKS